MISLCIYNAHRTVVRSGPSEALVVMNHNKNVGRLTLLPLPHKSDVIGNEHDSNLINARWMIKCCCSASENKNRTRQEDELVRTSHLFTLL